MKELLTNETFAFFKKSLSLFIATILSTILADAAERSTSAKAQFFEQYKFKRAMLTFLDPKSLGKCTFVSKDLNRIVEGMHYFKENKEFLKNIQDIKLTLSELELLGENAEENQEQIKDCGRDLSIVLNSLYPHIQSECNKVEGGRVVPDYDPNFCGHKARDQALAETIKAHRAELQPLFSKSLFLSSKYLEGDESCEVDSAVSESFLADRDTIIAGIPDEELRLFHREWDEMWITNPNISPEEYKRLVIDRYLRSHNDWYNLYRVFSNPVHPDESIKKCFRDILESSEEGAKINKAQLEAATGIALNPVAVIKFGESLLNWIIKNEEKILFAETIAKNAVEGAMFPLSSLMYNFNLPEAVCEKLVNYLLISLKQRIFSSHGESLPKSTQASEIKAFSEWLINFAKTAHGSEFILKKLDTILSDPHFSFEFKKALIESLFKGFDWNYYFKNYSLDHDVKLPSHFPEKAALAIMCWLSQEVPQPYRPIEILEEMILRGGLNSEAVQKTIDIIISHWNINVQFTLLLALMEKSTLYEAHYQRIRIISELYPKELKAQILGAIPIER